MIHSDPIRSLMKGASSLILLSLLILTGCGWLRSRVAEELDEETVSEVKDYLLSLEASQEYLASSEELEEVSADLLQATGDPSTGGGSFGLAPSALPEAAQSPCTFSVTLYSQRRLKTVHRECNYPTGFVEKESNDLAFQWSSSPRGSGDLNDTPPSPSYVSTTVNSSAYFRKVQAGPATLTGFREWHTSPLIHYLNFDLNLTLPNIPRIPLRTLHWYGTFPTQESNGVQYGTFTRTVSLTDGTTDTRTWSLSLAQATTLEVSYSREVQPSGFRATGSGTFNTQGTRCRRDDQGSFTLNRIFPQEATPDVQPVSEVVVITRNENVIEESGTLYLSDGKVLKRLTTRTIVRPTQCGDNELPWAETVIRKNYRGVEVSFTVTKGEGGVTITGMRTLPNGSTQNFTLVRTETGITTISSTATGPKGTAEIELTISPSGHAEGTITITRTDGTVDVIEVNRDLKGYKLHRRDRPLAEFRRINRGEL